MDTQTFDLVWLSGVIGVGLPLLISLVKRVSWPLWAKRALAVGASVVAGVVAVGVEAGWAIDGEILKLAAASIVQIYVVASVTYQSFWKDSTIEATLSATEVGY